MTTAALGSDLARLSRASLAFVCNPLPVHYFEIDQAFVRLMPDTGARAFANALQASTPCRHMLTERYMAPRYTLDDLLVHADGSLGHAYRAHMERYGLSLDFFPAEVPANDFTYFRLRTFQAHDIEHTIVGFASDITGEFGMIGFFTGQADRYARHSFMAATGWLYGGLMAFLYGLAAVHRTPRDIPAYFRAFWLGRRIGKNARPLFGVRWEEMFDVPIAELRQRLDLPVNRSST